MAKFPERDEFIKQVAEHALDKFTYCGRTIREWVALITSTDDELIRDRDEWKQRAEAAESDINMCCPCEVCTRSCTYDKVNPYDECADFEWRGPCAENGGVKNGCRV